MDLAQSRCQQRDQTHQENDKNRSSNPPTSATSPILILHLLRIEQTISPTSNKLTCLSHILFNVINPLPLSFHQNRHVQKNLMQLRQAPLYIQYSLMPLFTSFFPCRHEVLPLQLASVIGQDLLSQEEELIHCLSELHSQPVGH